MRFLADCHEFSRVVASPTPREPLVPVLVSTKFLCLEARCTLWVDSWRSSRVASDGACTKYQDIDVVVRRTAFDV